MPVLHNRISNDELKAKMLAESEPRTTISFYKYFTIASPQQTRDALYQVFTALDVFGRVYLAHEGINAQISVPQSKLETFRQQLYTFDPALDGLRLNIALEDDGKSFWVLRMKVRDRIVADGIDDPSFDASNVGDYLKAADVNVCWTILTRSLLICATIMSMKLAISKMLWKSRRIRFVNSCQKRLKCCGNMQIKR